jgi:hypothetical protein
MMIGDRSTVAQRLTQLVDLPEVIVTLDSRWMPRGAPILKSDGVWDVTPAEEVKIDRLNDLILPEESEQLRHWWLAASGTANTPNWDIASTCEIDGKSGLLLIEAKAHEMELRGEEKGKKLNPTATDSSFANHLQIGRAIADAAAGFQQATSRPWAISRDQRYQMSNRFATACKITEIGYPVVLVYLGFLNAHEMSDQGLPFKMHDQWDLQVKMHSKPLFPEDVWNNHWNINGQKFVPLIRSIEWEFEAKV